MLDADPWPPLTVARLARRDGRRCCHCGTDVGLSVQHRAVKGMGGRNSAERPSNGIILCALLNAALEQDASLADWADARGWKISTSDDPEARLVWDQVAYCWVQLGDDWTRTELR